MEHKKIEVEDLIKFLTTSNKSFDLIKLDLERMIFGHDIIDDFEPMEYQRERLKQKEDYDNRFIISAAVTGMAITEYLIYKRYSDLYKNELIGYKKKLYPNILRIREKIIKELPSDEFIDDDPDNINDTFSIEQLINFITDKSNDIKNLINRTGNFRSIYFHFNAGLGQVIIDRNRDCYNEEILPLINRKINEVIFLANAFF